MAVSADVLNPRVEIRRAALLVATVIVSASQKGVTRSASLTSSPTTPRTSVLPF